MAEDDQQWRSLLTGAPVPEASEALRAEAQRLRGAIAERFETERAALHEAGFDAEGLWARIRQTGREQRVFDGEGAKAGGAAAAPAPGTASPRWSGVRRWRWPALGAAVAALAWLGLQPALVGVRGDAQALPPVSRESPAAAAQTLAEALRRAGARVEVEPPAPDRPGARLTVAVNAPPEPGDRVDTVLAREGIARPTSRRFVVELRPAAP